MMDAMKKRCLSLFMRRPSYSGMIIPRKMASLPAELPTVTPPEDVASIYDDVTHANISGSRLLMDEIPVLDIEQEIASSDKEDNDYQCEISEALWEYQVLETLGQGSFGTVILAENLGTEDKVAIKIMKKPEDPDYMYEIYREAVIMKRLDHPNIVKMYEMIESDNFVFLVMEYCNGGDLFRYNLNFEGEKIAKIIFRQIASALQHCHEHNIVHRDLKLENILVDGDKIFKISDFGLSNNFNPESFLSSYCGTDEYMAPEMMYKVPYVGPEVDIWSLGVILYNLVTLDQPFKGDTREELIEAVIRGQYSIPSASEDCKDLIRQMLTVDPTQRATIQEIIHSRWLTEDSPEPSAEESSRKSSSSDLSSQKIIETDILTKDSPEDSMEQTSSRSSDSSSQKIVQTSVLSPDSSEQSMEEKSITAPPKRRPRPVRWWRAVKKVLGQCCCSYFSDPETCDYTSATFLDNNPQFWRQ